MYNSYHHNSPLIYKEKIEISQLSDIFFKWISFFSMAKIIIIIIIKELKYFKKLLW